jgi:NADPH:quinone reductase-like Zn-dependent oxidoreductase
MKAMLIYRYGAPDVFTLGEIDTPRPRQGEVLVRVRASSVNPVDAAIRAGMLKSFVRLRLPAVLGVDIAGEVVELGGGVTRFAVDDRVYAFTGIRHGGSYGEYAAIPERALAVILRALDWAQAGTVPGVGATAYEAFTEQAPVRTRYAGVYQWRCWRCGDLCSADSQSARCRHHSHLQRGKSRSGAEGARSRFPDHA